jgi:hypothetical protein
MFISHDFEREKMVKNNVTLSFFFFFQCTYFLILIIFNKLNLIVYKSTPHQLKTTKMVSQIFLTKLIVTFTGKT